MTIESSEHNFISALLKAIKEDMQNKNVEQFAVVKEVKEDFTEVFVYSRPIN